NGVLTRDEPRQAAWRARRRNTDYDTDVGESQRTRFAGAGPNRGRAPHEASRQFAQTAPPTVPAAAIAETAGRGVFPRPAPPQPLPEAVEKPAHPVGAAARRSG